MKEVSDYVEGHNQLGDEVYSEKSVNRDYIRCAQVVSHLPQPQFKPAGCFKVGTKMRTDLTGKT